VSIQEIESAIHQLSPAEVAQLRDWLDDYVEDRLELTDGIKAKLDQSRRDVAAGNFSTRQPT
jgi:hypothetical protein